MVGLFLWELPTILPSFQSFLLESRTMKRCILLALVVFVSGALPGCGGSGEPVVWVTGSLLKGGSKYQVPSDQDVTITFNAIEIQTASGKVVASTEPFVALFDQKAGTFKVPGKDGSGIPPGKYRISITSKMLREALNTSKAKQKPMDREKDYLEDKFGPATSPIIREIKSSTDLTIDMDKPTEGATGPG